MQIPLGSAIFVIRWQNREVLHYNEKQCRTNKKNNPLQFMFTRRNFIKVTAAGGALVSFGQFADARSVIEKVKPDNHRFIPDKDSAEDAKYAVEERKQIPVIADVDVVVAGEACHAWP